MAKISLDREVEKYKAEKEKEINQRLLGKFLIENFDRFKRFVVQTTPWPYAQFFHTMSEIGMVSGGRLFFEVGNKEIGAVNIYEEEKKRETSPPTVVHCDLSNALCHQIVDFLHVSSVVEQSNENREFLTVPEGFYVIEFTIPVRRGENRIVTCPPIKAKTFEEVLPEYYRWPGLWCCPYPKLFHVYTKDGRQDLNAWPRPFAGPGPGPREYVLTLPK